jgi:hypothetical protein
MILFIWSPSTFPHFANDRSHKKTFLLIKHINDKEKIGNYLNLPSPLFSLCHFNSFLELLLSIIIPQTAGWKRSLDQITFDQRSCFQLDRNFSKKTFFSLFSGKESFDPKSTVSKSYYLEGSQNSVLQYCIEHTTELHPVQKKLIRYF